MSSTAYGDAYGAFLAGGFGAKSEVLPSGNYPVRIALVKGDQAQGKSFRVGVRVVVLDGHPTHGGKSTWLNQTLTLPKPGDDKSTTAFMMFLKFMVGFGGEVINEAIKQGTPPEKLHELLVVGTEGNIQVKGDRPFNGKMQQDFVAFEATAVPSPMGGMIQVGGSAPAAPVAAAPAPVAVAVALPVAVAPVPVAVAVEAVAANAPSPEVLALQAQLAALQAAQAPVPAAAPAAVPGPSF